MRTALLIPLFALGANLALTGHLLAADGGSESADAVAVAKQVAVGIQAIKDSTGTYPASATLPVTINGQTVQMVTTVTVLPGAFSFKSAPTASSAAGSPVANMSVDINGSTSSTLSLVGIYASGADKADIVGFSTSGTEFAVSYSLNGKTVQTTSTVTVAAAAAAAPAVSKAAFSDYHLPSSSPAKSEGSSSAEADASDTSVASSDAGTGDATGSGVIGRLQLEVAAPVYIPQFSSPQTTPVSRETP